MANGVRLMLPRWLVALVALAMAAQSTLAGGATMHMAQGLPAATMVICTPHGVSEIAVAPDAGMAGCTCPDGVMCGAAALPGPAGAGLALSRTDLAADRGGIDPTTAAPPAPPQRPHEARAPPVVSV